MEDCIFCKISNGEIPAEIQYQDDKMIAFHDLNPQAPVHLLLIPKKHIPTLLDITSEDAEIMGNIFTRLPQIAKKGRLTRGLQNRRQLQSSRRTGGFSYSFSPHGQEEFQLAAGIIAD